MASTAAEIDPRLITFVLPGIPESVRMARFHVRAALSFHELDEYADDAEIITSELVLQQRPETEAYGARAGTVGR